MKRACRGLAANNQHKQELLELIYEVYAAWSRDFPLVCQKGCSSCCTRSVTMTSLEGEVIFDFVSRSGRTEWFEARLAESLPGACGSFITTNQFAEACLKQQEIDPGDPDGRDYGPCMFLEHNSCSIYEVRPFGCRSFGSLVRCSPEKAAVIYPIHLTVNTVFMQIIEHINSDSGYWSSMTEILYSLVPDPDMTQNLYLLKAAPIPGWLLEPREKKVIHGLLNKIRDEAAGRRTGVADLIDNLPPIL